MPKTRTASITSAHDWFANHIADDAPPVMVNQQPAEDEAAERLDRDHDADTSSPNEAPDTDEQAQPAVQTTHTVSGLSDPPIHQLDDPEPPHDANSKARRVLWITGIGVVILAAAIVAALSMFGGGPPPPVTPVHHALQPITPVPPATSNLPVPQQDQAVPYTPWSTSCTPTGGSGQPSTSRSPLALTDTASDSAWVCGRGPQESLTNGQILHVQFICNASQPQSACSYELNSLSVTPGWVAKTPGGKDEWLQHRVVRKMQVNFFNGSQPAGEPIPVDTQDAHGPVPVTLPAKVLASRADIIILYTERAPAGPPVSADPNAPASGSQPAPGALATTILGQPDSGPAASDAPAETSGDAAITAADATFAMSQLEFFGHSPN